MQLKKRKLEIQEEELVIKRKKLKLDEEKFAYEKSKSLHLDIT